MNTVTKLCEISSEDNGAKIVFASDDYFGIAENLLKESEPIKTTLCLNGHNIMDAWVTRRKRLPKHDYAIIKLAARAEIHLICVDTSYLNGNVPVKFSVQASELFSTDNDDTLDFYQNRDNKIGRRASTEEALRIKQLYSKNWQPLIEPQSLIPTHYFAEGISKRYFMIESKEYFTHLRLNIFPAGGISRLRVYGIVSKPIPMPSLNWRVNLVSKVYGGNCIGYSNCYNNTHPNNLIKNTECKSKNDGWHTPRHAERPFLGIPSKFDARHIDQITGEEWAVFQLGYTGKIGHVEVHTLHCLGDAPFVIRVQGLLKGTNLDGLRSKTHLINQPWKTIISYTIINPGTKQVIYAQNHQNKNMAYVRLLIKPDGCLSRFKVLGDIDD